MERRSFLKSGGMAGCGLALGQVGCQRTDPTVGGWSPALEEHIQQILEDTPIMGLSVCAFEGSEIVAARGYGWADRAAGRRREVTSINNIGSVSKLITGTAVMQEVERGNLDLDVDVAEYLPFPIRNPRHLDAVITPRHMLTHVSSITEGPAYGRSYACGDPTMPLADWVPATLTPAGRLFGDGANFHEWPPEGRWAYANLPWAVLALIVERIAGKPFVQVCRERIWEPLGMNRTSWYIQDLAREEMARPYTYYEDGVSRAPNWPDQPLVAQDGGPSDPPREGFFPHCFYAYPNYPDGGLRTSADQLARFVMAAMNGGTHRGARILAPETQQAMLTPQFPKALWTIGLGREQGLAWWRAWPLSGEEYWGHGGSDPGISTVMSFRKRDGRGIVLMANTAGAHHAMEAIAWHYYTGRILA